MAIKQEKVDDKMFMGWGNGKDTPTHPPEHTELLPKWEGGEGGGWTTNPAGWGFEEATTRSLQGHWDSFHPWGWGSGFFLRSLGEGLKSTSSARDSPWGPSP